MRRPVAHGATGLRTTWVRAQRSGRRRRSRSARSRLATAACFESTFTVPFEPGATATRDLVVGRPDGSAIDAALELSADAVVAGRSLTAWACARAGRASISPNAAPQRCIVV